MKVDEPDDSINRPPRVKQFDVARTIRLSRGEIPIVEWSEKRKRYEITVVIES